MKYLMTGGSGNLGTELQKHIRTYAPRSSEFDIRYGLRMHTVFFENRHWSSIDTIIHCAAYTNVPGAETDPKAAIEANIIGTRNISLVRDELEKMWHKAIKIVYISTDYVYAGTTGNYVETSMPNPFNFYGFTKLAGEAYIDKNRDLVIRTSFKPNRIWSHAKAFTDLYTSADYVDIIAQDIAMVIEKNVTGIINVGTERKSVYDLALRRNADVGQMSVKEILSVNLPTDISMNIDKLLGIKGLK